MVRALAAVVVALLIAVAAGCADEGDADGPPRVVGSFFPLAEAAARVGGDAVEVTDLTPAGTEPHDVELAADEVDAVLDAEVVVFLGAGFQPAVEDVVDQRDGPSIDVLDAVDAGDDPHVWLDPRHMAHIVEAVAGTVIDEVPDERADVRARADAYRAELEELDAALAAQLDDCERDLVVTAHDAFGTLARRYGLRTEAITGVSPEAEPDPGRLAELADLVEREGVTTVFTEELVSPEVAEALAREAGVGTAVLDPVESRPEGGYLGAMRRNGDALAEALGCR